MTKLQWGKQSNNSTSKHNSAEVTRTTLQWDHKLLVDHTWQGPEHVLYVLAV